MAIRVNVHEAKTNFSRLLERVGKGEEIIICKSGKAVARLDPIEEKPTRRVAGTAIGKVVMSEDFDEPLPDSVMRSFEE